MQGHDLFMEGHDLFLQITFFVHQTILDIFSYRFLILLQFVDLGLQPSDLGLQLGDLGLQPSYLALRSFHAIRFFWKLEVFRGGFISNQADPENTSQHT